MPRPDTAQLRERGETSVDLRLGRWFRSFKPSQHSQARLWHADEGKPFPAVRTNEHFVRFGSEFVLHPGRFVLAVTMEWLTLPKSMSGSRQLHDLGARSFLAHLSAVHDVAATA